MDNLITTVRALIATTPTRWLSLVETLPVELLRRPAAPGQWSALNCLQHLIEVEPTYQFRLQAFLAGQDFAGIEPNIRDDLQVAPAALAAEFDRMRQETLQSLDALSPEDLTRRVRHLELGPVTLEEMLHLWAAHDLNHTIQAERALMQPFIAGSGSWHVYFADHELRQE